MIAEHDIVIDGARTHLWRTGRGTPLVALHGAGPGIDAQQNWSGVWEALGASFDVIAPDLAGFGQTAHPVDPPSGPRAWIDLRVEQVVGLLDALELEAAWLVGISRGGGAVALRMAIDHPGRLRGIIVLGAGGYVPAPDPAREAALQAAAAAFYDDPSQAAMERIIRRFVTAEELLPAPVSALAQARRAAALAPGAERSYRAMWSGDLRGAWPTQDELAAIEVPVLLLHGGEDQLAAVDTSVALRAAIGEAHLHVLPKAGHWLHVDQPGLFTYIVSAFVAVTDRGC